MGRDKNRIYFFQGVVGWWCGDAGRKGRWTVDGDVEEVKRSGGGGVDDGWKSLRTNIKIRGRFVVLE